MHSEFIPLVYETMLCSKLLYAIKWRRNSFTYIRCVPDIEKVDLFWL